jgi:REP element-mobilizing transposase RayT
MHVKPVRHQNQRCLHFITFSCYRRMRLLDSPAAKETFERTLERVRVWYGCYIVGYVVMPEHVHLLISEPERSKLSVTVQMLKQITSQNLHAQPLPRFWQVRYKISQCGAKPSVSRSCATFIAIRCDKDWCRGPRIGNGAVLYTMRRGWKGLLKSNRDGPHGGESEWESCSWPEPTLPQKTKNAGRVGQPIREA